MATSPRPQRHDLDVRARVTVDHPRHDVYTFFSELANLPRFMRHLESVESLDGELSEWRAKDERGKGATWVAELCEEVEDERLCWRSLEGSDLGNEGCVELTDSPHGTEILVQLRYHTPEGRISRSIESLFGACPERTLQEDLQQLAHVLRS